MDVSMLCKTTYFGFDELTGVEFSNIMIFRIQLSFALGEGHLVDSQLSINFCKLDI